jgi:hypothetical protein
MAKRKLKTVLPATEVVALLDHLREAAVDPEYSVIVNYPVTEVIKVAKSEGIDLDNIEIHSLPNRPPSELWRFRKTLNKFNGFDKAIKKALTGDTCQQQQ